MHESVNMAALWKLPVVYVCENNLYAMGTSNARAAFNTKYYTKGDLVPGFKCEASNVLVVRETIKFAKQYTLENGPLFMEYNTYRFHGHSMSDPGITYRTRDEIKHVRDFRDPINNVKRMLLENSWATDEEMKAIEKELRKQVEDDIERAMKDEQPEVSELYTTITQSRPYVRGVSYDRSQLDYEC